MNKILAMSLVLLAGVSLSACGNNSKSQENASLKSENYSLKAKQQSKENSSIKAENESLRKEQNDNSTNSNSSSQSANTTKSISNGDEAIAAAEAKYGDNNGDWQWECLTSDTREQRPEGFYFVKAISKSAIQNGSMTGTAMSVEVWPDGSITEIN